MNKSASPLEPVIMTVLGFVFFAGCAPLLLHYVGISYISAEASAASPNYPAWLVAGLTALLTLYLVAFTNRIDRLRAQQGKEKASILLKISAGLLLPAVGGMLGYLLVAGTAPMAAAAVLGGPVQSAYTVREASVIGSKGCRPKVSFSGLPFLLDSVCDVPVEQVRTLKRGSRVVLTGKGTSSGLFYSDLIVADWTLR